jgi:hypothetical protein
MDMVAALIMGAAIRPRPDFVKVRKAPSGKPAPVRAGEAPTN